MATRLNFRMISLTAKARRRPENEYIGSKEIYAADDSRASR